MAILEARQIQKTYLDKNIKVPALIDSSLSVSKNEFVSIIGPSGCGKSTLLDIIAGILLPDEGNVYFQEADCTGKQGQFGYMPQSDVLFPWRTVSDNVILPLEIQGVSKKKALQIARPYFERFGLAGFEDQYPRALSGGMKQRANFLRTVLPKHPLLLLDEPFGRLDALTRKDLQQWLLERWGEIDASVLLVTHDIDEAISLSDRIYVMSKRPGTIKHEITVPFDRPRDPSIQFTPTFNELKKTLVNYLQE